MSYTVLARRYRSTTFDEIVGQQPIAMTLKNAIDSDRVAHAYLFCGTRGVGKTSMARILAKALNCTQGPTSSPCGQCDSCRSVAVGEDVDVIEIDGASNRGIDNIRELRTNAIYRPARSRYKIYIIDEVHMLSTEAFNALLKTLEEPPAHVKFIFATTEANKVPATIQSRCQRFDFRPIPADEIATQLEAILGQEQVSADTAVVRQVARLANGSMRDALSLLDQLLSLGQKQMTLEQAASVLPIRSYDALLELLGQLVEGEAAAALQSFEKLLTTGQALPTALLDMIECVRSLMLARACGTNSDLVELPGVDEAALHELAARLEAVDWAYAITVLEHVYRSARNASETSRALADVALIRLSQIGQRRNLPDALRQLERSDSTGEKKKSSRSR